MYFLYSEIRNYHVHIWHLSKSNLVRVKLGIKQLKILFQIHEELNIT